MIIKSNYDESWDQSWYLFPCRNSMRGCALLNDYSNSILDEYHFLNKKRKYLQPEMTVEREKMEDRDSGTSFREYLERLND